MSETHDAIWKIGNETWSQLPGAGFRPHSIAGRALPVQQPDADFAFGARHCASCTPTRYFPPAFKFCTDCGGALVNAASAMQWLPPYGSGSITRNYTPQPAAPIPNIERLLASPRTAGPDIETGLARMPLPDRGGLTLFVGPFGGYRDALFAVSRSGGLWLWARRLSRWLALKPAAAPLGPLSLPSSFCNFAAIRAAQGPGDCLLLPADAGPTLLQIDAQRGEYSVTVGAGHALGGAAVLSGNAFMPVNVDGRLHLATLGSDKASWRNIASQIDLPASVYFAPPLIDDNNRRMVWISEAGFLEAQLPSASSLRVQWTAWPEQGRALLAFGPPYRDGTGDWQLLFSPQRESAYQDACFYQRLQPGSSAAKPVMMPRVSTGSRCFHYSVPVRAPWDKIDEARYGDQRRVFCPLMELDEKELIIGFLSVENYDEPLMDFFASHDAQLVDFCFLDSSGRYHPIARRKMEEPWHASVFFHDDALWLYLDSTAELLRWSCT